MSKKVKTEYIFGSFLHHPLVYDFAKDGIVLIDEEVYRLHKHSFALFQKTIIIPSGEAHKQQQTVDSIYQQLIKLKADRTTTLIGVGGGVATDITGYVASTYMRGIPFVFVPTTLLAQVDASIGGKNGIDVGVYKNIIGTINQPKYLFLDTSFLTTLPQKEWINGMAEVIKHACIKDKNMFLWLEKHTLEDFQQNEKLLSDLILQNVSIKRTIVEQDPYEQGDRKLLNFGHTLGHAIENTYHLSHGEAVAIGMVFAAKLSGILKGLATENISRIQKLVVQYGLPCAYDYDVEKVFCVLQMDKKKSKKQIHFILLTDLGQSTIELMDIDELYNLMQKEK